MKLVLKWTISLQMMNSLSLHHVFSGASYLQWSLLSRTISKCFVYVCVCWEGDAVDSEFCLLQEMWCYFFSSGQNFGPLLLKLAICTCGWNLNIMEVKWKAGIFLLGVILLLIWNLLSSTTSCSLYMCQVSDSVVSDLVFELFMCVANHTKCY